MLALHIFFFPSTVEGEERSHMLIPVVEDMGCMLEAWLPQVQKATKKK